MTTPAEFRFYRHLEQLLQNFSLDVMDKLVHVFEEFHEELINNFVHSFPLRCLTRHTEIYNLYNWFGSKLQERE